ncbi:hypothetical protein J8273_0848 [Carpediemonas membranifera]|uniref:Uncharacterized protein n=1 Tax=Carpediemonas membranifera TaxID=201153 RepID=A0A8J6AYT5_9EUKA|nr:hypothetical protein J8273_0848 [Carpediemonas membranifera]|eukprot:KAG9397363.1 hypothetical protein J8273_0848 [Carpediemonas membranifera]
MLAIPKIDEPTLAEDDPVLQDLSEKKHKSKLRKSGENAAISRLASVLRPKRQEQCLNLLRMKLSSFTPIEVSRLNTKFNNTLACLALEEDDSVIETYLRAFAFRGQALLWSSGQTKVKRVYKEKSRHNGCRLTVDDCVNLFLCNMWVGPTTLPPHGSQSHDKNMSERSKTQVTSGTSGGQLFRHLWRHPWQGCQANTSYELPE